MKRTDLFQCYIGIFFIVSIVCETFNVAERTNFCSSFACQGVETSQKDEINLLFLGRRRIHLNYTATGHLLWT